MVKPLLIHSLSEHDEIILGLVDRNRPSSIIEIGSEHGGFSQQLYQRCKSTGAQLVTIEPFPAPSVVELAKTANRLANYLRVIELQDELSRMKNELETAQKTQVAA